MVSVPESHSSHLVRIRDIPVLPDLRLASALTHHIVSRSELYVSHAQQVVEERTNLLYTLEHGSYILAPPTIHDRLYVPLRVPPRSQECLDFRAKPYSPSLPCPEKRLDPIAISGGDEDVTFRVVQDEGELSAKMGQEVEAVSFIQRKDQLRVTVSGKRV
jgi:hypothetical protein